MTGEDLKRLCEIEQACFAHPLTEEQLRSLAGNGTVLLVTARADRRIAGYVWAQTVLDEGYIGNVAVLPAFRRMGIADGLMQALAGAARERGLSFLTLEVRASNLPAIALYEKNGYVPAGRRRNYYADPKEDAILMTLNFA
ncbi:MAG: ribosomal protein S18-alanine N-acetyltransferase [Oscillospiraceae bacterium]|nr:ribosomal protein S18-alanine N-acetyltransferase [Oscillospiraceae bacterium]